jgi:hypothetical protein
VLCYDPEVGNRNLEKDDAIVLSSRATETHEVFEKFHRHCSLAPTLGPAISQWNSRQVSAGDQSEDRRSTRSFDSLKLLAFADEVIE